MSIKPKYKWVKHKSSGGKKRIKVEYDIPNPEEYMVIGYDKHKIYRLALD